MNKQIKKEFDLWKKMLSYSSTIRHKDGGFVENDERIVFVMKKFELRRRRK